MLFLSVHTVRLTTVSYMKWQNQNRYQQILDTEKGLQAVARWVMSEGLLGQISLAKKQMNRVERA